VTKLDLIHDLDEIHMLLHLSNDKIYKLSLEAKIFYDHFMREYKEIRENNEKMEALAYKLFKQHTVSDKEYTRMLYEKITKSETDSTWNPFDPEGEKTTSC